MPDTERRRLCRRSGQWYEPQNDFLTAFCYYHTAGDYDKMLTVFEKDRGCSFVRTIIEIKLWLILAKRLKRSGKSISKRD